MRPGGTARLSLTWLGHATVVLEVAGRRLVTDPLLMPHNGPLRRQVARPLGGHWQRADAVLLSHLHHDHAELRSLRLLGGAPVLASPGNRSWLSRRGLNPRAFDGWTSVGDVEVRLVEAIHHSRPMPHRPNDACGHLVRSPGCTVWVAGDTSLYDEMSSLPDLAGVERIDLAVVPIGGWGPRLSPGHMGPEEAATACARTRARHALAYHWGTLSAPLTSRWGTWFNRPLEAFAEAVGRVAPACRVLRLRPGDAWSWRPEENA
jgi:L-ascorbate metabolism protein UlaG (beta-lactamase superfamily)